jgi:hypothetical protein
LNTASDLKYTNEIKAIIQEEFTNPTPDFVKHFAKNVYPSAKSSQRNPLFSEQIDPLLYGRYFLVG